MPPPQNLEADEEQVTELTDEERRWFSSLLTVGRRSKTIDVYGHPVVIQTLTTSDELRIGLYCRPYQDTNAFARAYQVAVCAAAVRSADGKALFTGDVIFSRGVGRTDLPGGNGRLLKESIQRLSRLNVNYFMPGHGTIVTGNKEVAENFQAVEASWFSYLQ